MTAQTAAMVGDADVALKAAQTEKTAAEVEAVQAGVEKTRAEVGKVQADTKRPSTTPRPRIQARPRPSPMAARLALAAARVPAAQEKVATRISLLEVPLHEKECGPNV